MTLTDDFSRKTWIYFLVEKSEAFTTFKLYKAKVVKEVGTPIRILRTDRGGEFTSSEFKHFCEGNGIRRQLTAAYTHQQNGVTERKNHTILNMVRSMMSAKKILKTCWPEAVNWTMHVLNRCPTLALTNMTPEEAWSGIKPSVDHFRIFGCIGHVHVPDERGVKFDAKSRKCIFFGVSDESKAYRFFDPISKKNVVSRDVVFEEAQQWSWDDSHKQAILADLEWENDADSGVEIEGDGKEPIETEVESTQSREEIEKSPTQSKGNTKHVESSPTQSNSSNTDSSQREGRIRKKPTWMTDYETGDGLSDEENA